MRAIASAPGRDALRQHLDDIVEVVTRQAR
jgi:hypothetical protein